MTTSRSEKRRWRITRLSASMRGCVREYVYEGTEEEMREHFRKTCVCKMCDEEMTNGSNDELYRWDKEQQKLVPSGEFHKIEPYDNVFATPCAYEWDVEEITNEPRT